jgi:hypothetical protein
MPLKVEKSTIKTPSCEAVQAKLESARKEYKEFDEGHRMALYQSLQRVAEAAVLVVADENIETHYREKMGNNDVLRAALMFIFDPQSLAEQKEASKRASALWCLIVKLKVAVENIAKAIPKHGGIEKLARLAAKSRLDEGDVDQDEDEDEDQDEPEEEDEDDKPKHKLGNQLIVGLSPKINTKLYQFADKTRIKIIGYIRMSPDESPTIDVKKIIEAPVKKKEAKSKTKAAKKKISKSAASKKKRDNDDDESDWE